MSCWAASSGEDPSPRKYRMPCSVSSFVSPSEQTRSREPATIGKRKKSGTGSSLKPTARVITLLCGCTSASAGVMAPASRSSWTIEWSTVSCSSVPSR